MAAQDLIPTVQWNGHRTLCASAPPTNVLAAPVAPSQVPIVDTHYVDDGLFFAMDTAANIIARTETVIQVVHDALTVAGLRPNYKVHKTSAMFFIRGEGATQLRHDLFIDRDAQLHVQTVTSDIVHVHVVRAYQHLGTIETDTLSHHPEIVRWVSLGRLAFRASRFAFAARSVRMEAKRLFLQSLVLSTTLYNAAVWCPLSRPSQDHLHDAWVHFARVISGSINHQRSTVHYSDVEALGRAGLPGTDDLCRASRLRYLPRLIAFAPAQLLGALQILGSRDDSWLCLVVSDLEWMRERVDKLSDLPPPRTHFSTWECFACEHLRAWKRYIAIALQVQVDHYRRVAQASQWRRSLSPLLAEAGIAGEVFPKAVAAPGQLPCHACPRSFVTLSALHSHLVRVHGARSFAAPYARGPACPGCMQYFHTRRRALAHLAFSSPRCLLVAIDDCDPMTADQIETALAADRKQYAEYRAEGRAVHFAKLPVTRLAGPPTALMASLSKLTKSQAKVSLAERGLLPGLAPTAASQDPAVLAAVAPPAAPAPDSSVSLAVARAQANQLAETILLEVDRTRRPVSSLEVLQVLRAWGFGKNLNRKNVLPAGQQWVFSDTFGLVRQNTGRVGVTQLTRSWSHVPALLNRWLRDHSHPSFASGFPCSSMTLNSAFASRRHRDTNNAGPSCISAFGQFEGGRLAYWPDDAGSTPVDDLASQQCVHVQLPGHVTLFDGNRAHEVEAFTGERFSVVWFTTQNAWTVPTEVTQQLAVLGFDVPPLAGVRALAALLPRPRPPPRPSPLDRFVRRQAAAARAPEPPLQWPCDDLRTTAAAAQRATAQRAGRPRASPSEAPLVSVDVGGVDVSCSGPSTELVPRCIDRPVFVVLHLFSGVRRSGDFQQHLQWLWPADTAQLLVLSVDIALDPVYGNLASADAIAWWQARIRDGQVRGWLGGPPCETWSVARYLPDGPPPLRSLLDIWGLAAVDARQSAQLTLGNFLLQASITLALTSVAHGGVALIEHPAIPTWRLEAVSIWFLRITRALIAAPCVSEFEIDQCEHGQVSKSPTHLLAVRLPTLEVILRDTPGSGSCSHGSHQSLRGVSQEGHFRTAQKKQYPSGLCRCFARAFVDALLPVVADVPSRGEPLAAEFDVFCPPFDGYEQGADAAADLQDQPDFAPAALAGAFW